MTDSPSSLRIQHHHEGTCVELQLDRPASHNALDLATLRALETACLAIAVDPGVRVAIVSAVGPSFAAGGDLREIRALAEAPDGAEEVLEAGRAALAALATMPTMTIAALDGAALGGGAELALACDVRFAGPSASLALRQARMGLCPAWDTTRRLTRLLGQAVASELLLLGQSQSAERLVALGLARAAPRGARLEALEWAASLAEVPPRALRENVTLLRAAYGAPAAATEHERRAFRSLFGGAEHREALAAFFEKRPPSF